MNKKQKVLKQMAKRAKAKENKKEKPNPSKKAKPRYISKAERAKLSSKRHRTIRLSKVKLPCQSKQQIAKRKSIDTADACPQVHVTSRQATPGYFQLNAKC